MRRWPPEEQSHHVFIKLREGFLYDHRSGVASISAGREKLAMAKLKEIKGVSHLSAVFGRWDLVADIEAPDLPR